MSRGATLFALVRLPAAWGTDWNGLLAALGLFPNGTLRLDIFRNGCGDGGINTSAMRKNISLRAFESVWRGSAEACWYATCYTLDWLCLVLLRSHGRSQGNCPIDRHAENFLNTVLRESTTVERGLVLGVGSCLCGQARDTLKLCHGCHTATTLCRSVLLARKLPEEAAYK